MSSDSDDLRSLIEAFSGLLEVAAVEDGVDPDGHFDGTVEVHGPMMEDWLQKVRRGVAHIERLEDNVRSLQVYVKEAVPPSGL